MEEGGRQGNNGNQCALIVVPCVLVLKTSLIGESKVRA
jgi:hypothetical protein